MVGVFVIHLILTPDITSNNEIWVELKSYSNRRGFQVWKYVKKGGAGSIGKELIVDRAANVRAPLEGVWLFNKDGEKELVTSVDNRWRFQVFNVKPTEKRKVTPMWSYSPEQFKARLENMNKIDNHKVIRTTLKTDEISFEASSVAKMDTISAWLLENANDIMNSLQ